MHAYMAEGSARERSVAAAAAAGESSVDWRQRSGPASEAQLRAHGLSRSVR